LIISFKEDCFLSSTTIELPIFEIFIIVFNLSEGFICVNTSFIKTNPNFCFWSKGRFLASPTTTVSPVLDLRFLASLMLESKKYFSLKGSSVNIGFQTIFF